MLSSNSSISILWLFVTPFSAESGEDESSADAGGGFVMTETVGHYVDEEGNQARAFSSFVVRLKLD